MEKVTVLVIEDNPTWQNRLRRWFERYECQVDVAGSYLEAESRLTQRTYDMVTLDMALSPDEEQSGVAGSSGWELLVNRLATDSPHTNVYVLSASFEGEPQRAFELNQRYGVKDFMPKGRGFDPTHLQAWVTEIREAPKPPAGTPPHPSPQPAASPPTSTSSSSPSCSTAAPSTPTRASKPSSSMVASMPGATSCPPPPPPPAGPKPSSTCCTTNRTTRATPCCSFWTYSPAG